MPEEIKDILAQDPMAHARTHASKGNVAIVKACMLIAHRQGLVLDLEKQQELNALWIEANRNALPRCWALMLAASAAGDREGYELGQARFWMHMLVCGLPQVGVTVHVPEFGQPTPQL